MRRGRFYRIQRGAREEVVSIDRLIPAHLESEPPASDDLDFPTLDFMDIPLSTTANPRAIAPPPLEDTPVEPSQPLPHPRPVTLTSRAGRALRKPDGYIAPARVSLSIAFGSAI